MEKAAESALPGRVMLTLITVDWVGVTALLAGLAVARLVQVSASHMGIETWWKPWLLPSYVVAFLTCLVGPWDAAPRLQNSSRIDS